VLLLLLGFGSYEPEFRLKRLSKSFGRKSGTERRRDSSESVFAGKFLRIGVEFDR
jgi:hypothetical protein